MDEIEAMLAANEFRCTESDSKNTHKVSTQFQTTSVGATSPKQSSELVMVPRTVYFRRINWSCLTNQCSPNKLLLITPTMKMTKTMLFQTIPNKMIAALIPSYRNI
mmetsp:Transcript_40555/g.48655  ORF Transcript_40555/g.48655 Transcript_40555/m.48655 type:complete len:106 (+) Transcript_40555:150-467(+)